MVNKLKSIEMIPLSRDNLLQADSKGRSTHPNQGRLFQ